MRQKKSREERINAALLEIVKNAHHARLSESDSKTFVELCDPNGDVIVKCPLDSEWSELINHHARTQLDRTTAVWTDQEITHLLREQPKNVIKFRR